MAFGDFSVTVNSYVIGKKTGTLLVDITDIGGLGTAVRSHDTDFEGQDGAHAGIDVQAARLIAVEFLVADEGGSVDAVLDELASLRTAWAPTSTNTNLTMVLPGGRSVVWSGRPRGINIDLSQLPFGVARCSVSFYCPNPAPTSGSL